MNGNLNRTQHGNYSLSKNIMSGTLTKIQIKVLSMYAYAESWESPMLAIICR